MDAFPLVQRVALYTTLKCNLSCRHCYIEGSATAVHPPGAAHRRLIESVASIGKPVDLTGGEPFMLRDLARFVDDLVQAGAEVGSVFTNGTLLRRRKETVLEIIRATGPLRWYVSLDGDQEAHNTLRGQGSFESAVDGADLLISLGQQVFVNTMLHSTVSHASLKRLHDAIVSHGFHRWRLDNPFGVGAWKRNRDAHGLTVDEGTALMAQVVGRWATAGLPFELEAGHILKYLDGTVYFLDSYSLNDSVCPCRTFPVWPNGDVSWCQDLSDREFVVGNLLESSAAEVYAAYAPHKERTIADVAAANGTCESCPLVSWCGTGCRVGAIGNGGGVNDLDPGACHVYNDRSYLLIAHALNSGLAARQIH